jgi:hypothetical protein
MKIQSENGERPFGAALQQNLPVDHAPETVNRKEA